jgi:hypothetical protein
MGLRTPKLLLYRERAPTITAVMSRYCSRNACAHPVTVSRHSDGQGASECFQIEAGCISVPELGAGLVRLQSPEE